MAFGIMVSRFKVLYGRMNLSPDRADRIVKACSVLHNFLSDENRDNDDCAPTGDGSSFNIMALQRIGRRSSDDASRVREAYLSYFNSTEGCLDWQWCHANRM